ncbi:MAG TPA: GNAT family N-acetyltransferase [Nitrososphaerales archaeon]|nr:GNAT family N-acetyltransferase [Nitrososphaerales archaeon]
MKVEIREARPSDKKPLMDFIKDVWEGHDYIPRVWDGWLRDKGSKMFVVLADGLQVGMNRVRFLEDGSAWFEGARVHPQFRGMGLATALGERSMRVAGRKGVDVYRLTSGTWNKEAHRQIARMGFKEAARVSVYVPQEGMRLGPQRGVRRAGYDDLPEVVRTIRTSREFRLGSGVMWDTFAAKALTRKVIARALGDGGVYLADGALGVAMGGGEGTESWKQVGFLTGDDKGVVGIVKHFLGLKGKGRTTRRLVYVPQGSRVIGALRRAGMKRDFSLILFESKAAKG